MSLQLFDAAKSGARVPLVLSAMIGILVGGIGIGMGITSIAAQDEGDEIEACVNRYNGDVRISRTGACASTETPLTWNQQGIPGEDGEDGEDGDDGDPGTTGSPGLANLNVVHESRQVPNEALASTPIECPPGQTAIGGGWDYSGPITVDTSNISVISSRQDPVNDRFWGIDIVNYSGSTAPFTLHALCADVAD